MVLSGANGVGKTTFAHANLSTFINQQAFLNADDIARTANPSDVEALRLKLVVRCFAGAASSLRSGCRFA